MADSSRPLSDPSVLRLALAAYLMRTVGPDTHVLITDAEIQQLRDVTLRIKARKGSGMAIWVDNNGR